MGNVAQTYLANTHKSSLLLSLSQKSKGRKGEKWSLYLKDLFQTQTGKDFPYSIVVILCLLSTNINLNGICHKSCDKVIILGKVAFNSWPHIAITEDWK